MRHRAFRVHAESAFAPGLTARARYVQLTGSETVKLVFSSYFEYWLKDKTPEEIREIFEVMYCTEGASRKQGSIDQ